MYTLLLNFHSFDSCTEENGVLHIELRITSVQIKLAAGHNQPSLHIIDHACLQQRSQTCHQHEEAVDTT